MKKIYMAPSQYVVKVHTQQMLAESVRFFNDPSDEQIDDAGDILTKEISDKSVWDSEW